MIRIQKPSEPRILREDGASLIAELCHRIDTDESATIEFDERIYGAPEIRDALRGAQYDKCCYCESKLGHSVFGDVEHFRPKRAVSQGENTPVHRPGYYWLAYNWNNLYLACEPCNRKHKRTVFPLDDDARRVRSHRDAHRLSDERPLLLDPGLDEPSEHLEFRRESVNAISNSPRGRSTIDTLQLNRDLLLEARRIRYNTTLVSLSSIKIWLENEKRSEALRPYAARSIEDVSEATRPNAEFSAMVRAAVRAVMPQMEVELPTDDADAFLRELEREADRGHVLSIPPRSSRRSR